MDSFVVVVTGDRNWDDRDTVRRALIECSERAEGRQVTLIHGKARGLDTIAGEIAISLDFQVVEVPPDWEKYGRAAGPIRNGLMLDYGPCQVHAFHNDIESSKGTKSCVNQAIGRELPVFLHTTGGNSSELDQLVL